MGFLEGFIVMLICYFLVWGLFSFFGLGIVFFWFEEGFIFLFEFKCFGLGRVQFLSFGIV